MMRSTLFITLFLYSISVCAQRDSTVTSGIYKTNHGLEVALPVVFFTGAFFGFKALDKHASLTEEDVLKLDPQDINSFDRPIAFYNPEEFEKAQSLSYVQLDFALASPLILLLDKKIRKDWKDILSLFLVAHAVDNAIYFSSVLLFPRARPLSYNPNVPMQDRIGEGKDNSFFSGHVSWAATSTFLMTKIYTDYHHIKGFKRIALFTGAAVGPLIVGYYRLEAGKHFRTDVITGLIVGAACGIGVPELHRIKNKDRSLSFRPFSYSGANGLSIVYNIK